MRVESSHSARSSSYVLPLFDLPVWNPPAQVDERVRSGVNSEGEHCDLWARQAEQAAAAQKTQSEFVPTKSNTPLEIFVTVHLKVR